MGAFFIRLFAPWRAGRFFEREEDFQQFLVQRNRFLNAVRVILFAVAAVGLILSYASDRKLYNYIAAGVPVHYMAEAAPCLLLTVNDSQYEAAMRTAYRAR